MKALRSMACASVLVAAAGGRIYVADVVNRRIVSVRFEHAAEASCAIEPAGRP